MCRGELSTVSGTVALSNVREAGGSGREKLKMVSLYPSFYIFSLF